MVSVCSSPPVYEENLIPIQNIISMFLQIDRPVQIYNTFADVTVDSVLCDFEECFGVSQVPGCFASRISGLIIFVIEVKSVISFLVSGELPVFRSQVEVDH